MWFVLNCNSVLLIVEIDIHHPSCYLFDGKRMIIRDGIITHWSRWLCYFFSHCLIKSTLWGCSSKISSFCVSILSPQRLCAFLIHYYRAVFFSFPCICSPYEFGLFMICWREWWMLPANGSQINLHNFILMRSMRHVNNAKARDMDISCRRWLSYTCSYYKFHSISIFVNKNCFVFFSFSSSLSLFTFS